MEFWSKFAFFANNCSEAKLGIPTWYSEFSSSLLQSLMHQVLNDDDIPPKTWSFWSPNVLWLPFIVVGLSCLSIPWVPGFNFFAIDALQLLSSALFLIWLFKRLVSSLFPRFSAAAGFLDWFFGSELDRIPYWLSLRRLCLWTYFGAKAVEVSDHLSVWIVYFGFTSRGRISPSPQWFISSRYLGANGYGLPLTYIMEAGAVALDMWYWKFEIIPLSQLWHRLVYLYAFLIQIDFSEKANLLTKAISSQSSFDLHDLGFSQVLNFTSTDINFFTGF